MSKTKSVSGVVVSDPIEVNRTFYSFHSELYTSQCSPDIWDGDNPFDTITFPNIGDELGGGLGDPISITEVQEAIKSLQNGKRSFN